MIDKFMPSFIRFIESFIHITIDALPFFIIGTFFGALLTSKFKPALFEKYLKKGFMSVINACALGAIIPGCSCSTAPMAQGLRNKGSALGTTTAFLMISPLLSPHILFLTFGLLGLKFTVGRLVFSFVWAIFLGVLFNFLEAKKVTGFADVVPKEVKKDDCCDTLTSHGGHDHTHENNGLWTNFRIISIDLGKYFLVGVAIASFISIATPESWVQVINRNPLLSYILAALFGIPIYVCEGEEVPLTLALLTLGLAEGPAFTFMLGAIGTCIPTIIMAQRIIGRTPTIVYVIGWFVFAMGSGYIISFV